MVPVVAVRSLHLSFSHRSKYTASIRILQEIVSRSPLSQQHLPTHKKRESMPVRLNLLRSGRGLSTHTIVSNRIKMHSLEGLLHEALPDPPCLLYVQK